MSDEGDRELNAWIAENVMRLVRVTRFGMDWWVPAEEIEVPLPSDGIRVENYKPTVSHDQAFMAAEQVMADNPDLGLVIGHMYQAEHTWQPPDPPIWTVEIDCSHLSLREEGRLPLAICRAVKAYREAKKGDVSAS